MLKKFMINMIFGLSFGNIGASEKIGSDKINPDSGLVRALKVVQAQIDSTKNTPQQTDFKLEYASVQCGCVINKLKHMDRGLQAVKYQSPFDVFECNLISQVCFQCCGWIFGLKEKDESKDN